MTFDDAITNFEQEANEYNGLVPMETVYELILDLKEDYAPTIEMTKSQKDLILRNQDEDKLYEIMGDGEGYYFNAEYWGNLEPHEVASAYLHPETIKVVGN